LAISILEFGLSALKLPDETGVHYREIEGMEEEKTEAS
jgi:hypothetical protein